MHHKPKIAVVGGGAAALYFCSFIDTNKYDVHLFEKNKVLARKFLVAGKGGFNLTHSEPIDLMVEKYTPSHFLKKALIKYSNSSLINWLKSIGIETFTGSSSKVYPTKSYKPITVLKSIEKILIKKGINFHFNHTLTRFKLNELEFNHHQCYKAEKIVFALGGGSWKVTGSDGTWQKIFSQNNIKTTPFEPSNCAFKINWKPTFISKHHGEPLKNILINCQHHFIKGEVNLTKFGIEGNAIYGLSSQIRNSLKNKGQAEIKIDFKPTQTHQRLIEKFQNSKHKSITDKLHKDLKISKTQIDLLKNYLTKEKFTDSKCLINSIKSFKLTIIGTDKLDKAISTVGGIDLTEVNDIFELKKLKNHYCIGEMLDWDAPTGGYLLQACYSMGAFLADEFNQKQ